jgi:hypothetical protein
MPKHKPSLLHLLANTLTALVRRVFIAILGCVTATPVILYTRVRIRISGIIFTSANEATDQILLTSVSGLDSSSRTRVRMSRTAGHARLRSKALLLGLFTLVLFTSLGVSLTKPLTTNAANASTINFQARLEGSDGAITADGNYNVEFKLYSSVTGGSALWTEDYLNSAGNGIRVVNGYLTTNLGSVTPFPSTIPWSQDLYVTMNIGGTSTGTPTWDGEMNPRLKLTAVPYAFQAQSATQLQTSNSGNVATLSFTTPTATDSIVLPNASGTVCLTGSTSCGFAATTGGTGYVQNSTSLQTNTNFDIQSSTTSAVTGVLQKLTGQTSDLLDFDSSTGSVMSGINASGQLYYQSGSYTGTIIQSTLAENTTYTLPDPGTGTATICLSTGNCAGSGGGITGSGTTNYLAVFNTASTLAASSQIYDNGSFVGVGTTTSNGKLSVVASNASQAGAFIQAAANATTGALIVKGGATPATGGDLADFETSAGTIVASVDKSGNLAAGAATFSGNLTATNGNVVIGTAGVTAGQISFANNSNSQLTLLQVQAPTGTGNVTYVLPTAVGGNSYTLCTTAGNCAGSGSGATATGGNANYIAKFSAAQAITSSSLYDNGSFVGLNTTTNSGLLSLQGASATQSTLFAHGTASSTVATAILQDGTGQTGDLADFDNATGTVLAKIDANGNLTAIAGTFSGLLTATGGETETGTASINTTGTATTTIGNTNSATTIGGNLTTTGTTTDTGAVTNNSTTTFNGNTSVSGSNTFTVGTGATALGGTLAVTGTTTDTGLLTINGGITDTGAFAQSGTGTFSTGTGTVMLNGATTDSSTLNVTGATTLSSAIVQGSGGLTIGSTTVPGVLKLTDGTTDGYTASLQSSTLTANQTFTLPTTGGTLCTTTTCASATGSVTTTGGTANYVARFTGTNSVGTGLLYDSGAGGFVGVNTQTNAGELSVTSGAVAEVALNVQGAASSTATSFSVVGGTSQSGNLIVAYGGNNSFDVLDNGDVYDSGRISVAVGDLASTLNAKLALQPGSVSTLGEVIEGYSGQTADLLDLDNSSGTVLAKINANGNLTAVAGNFSGLLSANGGATVANGTTLTNAGSTLNTSVAIGNLASGGNITTAAILDGATSFTVNQTTASQTMTLPTPSPATAGRVVYVSNIGTASFTMYGITAAPGTTQDYIWNGSAWTVNGSGTTGNYIANQTSQQTGNFNIQDSSASAVAATISGASSQTADLLDLDNSSGTKLAYIDAAGDLTDVNTTVTGALTVSGQATLSGGAAVTGTTTINTTGSATTTIGNASSTTNVGGAINVAGNGVLTGTLTVNSTSNSYIAGSLGLGGGTGIAVSPQAGSALTLQNSTWISAVDSTGSSYLNLFEANANNEIQTGASLDIDGGITLPADGGAVTFADMPFTSAYAAGTQNSYSFRIGTANALTVYGENDGSGNAQNVRVAIGSSITPAYTLDVGGDINSSASYREGGTVVIDGSRNLTVNNATVGGALGVAGNLSLTGSASTISGTAGILTLQETGDTYGSSSLTLENRTGTNGAVFNNPSLDLVDLGFVPSSGAEQNIRYEHRSGYIDGSGNTAGEFQIGPAGSPNLYIGAGTTGVLSTNFLVKGTANLNSTLNVSGTTTLATLKVSGATTLGTTSTAGSISFSDGTTDGYSVSLKSATQPNSVALTIPADANTADTICLQTLANCGGASSVSGTTNYVARFTSASSVGTGLLYDNGSFVGDNTTTNNGELSVVSGSTTETGLFIQGGASSSVASAIIQEGSSQSGDLLDLDNSSGTKLAYIDAAGDLTDVNTTVTGALTVSGQATLSGGAAVTGTTTINTTGSAGTTLGSSSSSTTIGGALTVSGTTTNNGNVSVTGSNTLTVGTGTTRLGGNLNVAGATTFTDATNSAVAFQVQNSTGSALLDANTATSSVGIVSLTTPGALTLSTSSGGSLAAGTYYYTVTAVDGSGGQTLASPESTIATTGGSSLVTLSWAAVNGATKYYVYRGTTSGGENVYYTTKTNSYIDTGATSTSGTPPSIASAYRDEFTSTGNYLNQSTTILTSTNSTTGFQVQNASGSAVVTADTLNNQLLLGQAGALSGVLSFANNANSYLTTLQVTAPSGSNAVLTLPGYSGVICLSTSTNCGSTSASSGNFINGGNTFGSTAVLGTNDNNGLNIVTNGTAVAKFSASGAAAFENSSNSTSAFQVQNASGATVLNVDTTNAAIAVDGSSEATTTLSSNLISSYAVTNSSYWTCSSPWTYTSTTIKTGANGSNCVATSANVSVTVGSIYYLSFTLSGGSCYGNYYNIAISVGGYSQSNATLSCNGTYTYTFTATTTGALTLVAPSYTNITFNNLSLQQITPAVAPLQVKDATGATTFQIYAPLASYNDSFFGLNAGEYNATGTNNIALGDNASLQNITGSYNTAIGAGALQNNSGSNNTAIGYNALSALINSSSNVGVGENLLNSISVSGNTVIGIGIGTSLLSGSNNNTIIGQNDLTYDYQAQSSNVIVGDSNGTYVGSTNILIGNNINNSNGSNPSDNNNIFIGNGLALGASQNSGINIGGTYLGTVGGGGYLQGSSTSQFAVNNASGAATLNVNTTANALYSSALASPVISTITTATTGGSIAASTTYYYKVTAVDAQGGETAASTESSKATGSGTATNTITVNWSAITGASYYNVYRGTTAGGESAYFTTTSTSYTDTGTAGTAATPPSTGTAYVTRQSASGYLQNTSSTTAFQLQSAAGSTSLNVDTTNNKVQLGGNMASPGVITLSTATAGGSLSASTTYYFKVTALDGSGGETTPSSEYSIATGSATATNTITASWTAISGATSYRVYYGTTAGGESAYFTTTSTSYTMTATTGSTSATPPSTNAAFSNVFTGTGDYLAVPVTINSSLTVGSAANGVVYTSGTYEPVLSGTARHQESIILTPEYAGAVLDATSDSTCSSNFAGTMTSGFNSTASQNYYNWTSASSSSQCYDVVVEVPIPSNFSAWNGAPTLTTYNSAGVSSVAVQAFDNGTADSNYTSYNSVASPSTATTETLNTLSSAYSANGVLTLKIRMSAISSRNTQIGNIVLNYYAKY